MRVTPRESKIERLVVNAILERNGVIDKTRSLSRRGYFDRIAVLSGVVYFIETKRPKIGRVSPHQRALHKEYIAAGANVVVIGSEEDLARWLSTLE
jgi:hypothetical protein